MYDIVFISYEEPNADEVYAELKARFPMAKRVHGVKGIHQAHIAAAKKCFTKMFWVVDGDARLKDDLYRMISYYSPTHLSIINCKSNEFIGTLKSSLPGKIIIHK